MMMADDTMPFMDEDSDLEDRSIPSPSDAQTGLSDKGGGEEDMDPLIPPVPDTEPPEDPPILDTSRDEEDDDPSVQLVKAVKNDSTHIIDDLLEKSTAPNMYTALLFSITMGRDHITKMFVDHPKYELLREMARLSRLGTLDLDTAVLEDQADGEEVESDITPIMLASLRNQYEIVVSLMSKGETIDEPHNVGCLCPDCSQQADKHREAKTRLNAYKALCSDAYVLLASEDPILRAFELGQKLRKLAQQEKHYKAEYLELADQCADFSTKILDRVRDGQELDTLLNEKSGSGLTSYGNLARLKLAVRFREKKFVAHPACQKKLSSLWMGTLSHAWMDSTFKSFLFVIALTLAYPILVVAYWVSPNNKVYGCFPNNDLAQTHRHQTALLAEFLQTPILKFVASTISYVTFIGLLVGFSITEQVSAGYTISEHPTLGPLYEQYSNSSPAVELDDFGVRVHQIRVITVILVIWIAGMVWEIIKKIISEQMSFLTDNMYNMMNLTLLTLYIIAFSFRFHSFTMVQLSVNHFSNKEGWDALARNESKAINKMYWLTADRTSWSASDPIVLSEAVMSIASIITICKLMNVFTLSERIGPLVLSLMKMIEDVLAFMVLFIFIIAAFCVGFHNLYWYFYSYPPEGETVLGRRRHSSFTSIGRIIELFFWSIFGLVEMEQDKFHTTEQSEITAVTGHVLFALYNWIMVIILINMLIAMMSRSYEIIAEFEDAEWKFARTKLFLEYMREGNTLAPPFNLVPTMKGVRLLHQKVELSACTRLCRGPGCGGCCKICIRRRRKVKEADLINDNNSNNNAEGVVEKKVNGIKGNFTNSSSKPDIKKPGEQYINVIAEIIKRITTKGNSADDEPDPIEQLQQDMSSMRQDVITNLLRQDRERDAMACKIETDMIMSRDTFTAQNKHLESEHARRLRELQDTMDHLDSHIKRIQEAMTTCLMGVQSTMTHQITDTRTQMQDHMVGVQTGMEAINMEFQALVKKQIDETRTEMEAHMSDMKTGMTMMNTTFQKHVTEQIRDTRSQMHEHMNIMKSEMEEMNRDFQEHMSSHIDKTREQTLEHMDTVNIAMSRINSGITNQTTNVDKIECAISKQAEIVTTVNDRLIQLCTDITALQEQLDKILPAVTATSPEPQRVAPTIIGRRNPIPLRSSLSPSEPRGSAIPTRSPNLPRRSKTNPSPTLQGNVKSLSKKFGDRASRNLDLPLGSASRRGSTASSQGDTSRRGSTQSLSSDSRRGSTASSVSDGRRSPTLPASTHSRTPKK